MATEKIVFVALTETAVRLIPRRPPRRKKRESHEHEALIELPEDEEELVEENKEKRKSGLREKLQMVKQRIRNPGLPKLLRIRPSMSRMRGGFSHMNCFRVQEDLPAFEQMELDRHRSIDLGIRRSSLAFFRIRPSCYQHPYHPYTPKQYTRLAWNVHHYKT